MPNDVEIVSLELNEHASQWPIPGARIAVGPRYHLRVSVRNRSQLRAYRVIADPRAIQYDAREHVLTVSFAEPEPAEHAGLYHVASPRYKELLPGADLDLEAHIPVVHNVLRAVQPEERVMDIDVERVDTSDVETVVCRLAYSESGTEAPRLDVEAREPPREFARRLREDATITEATFPVPAQAAHSTESPE